LPVVSTKRLPTAIFLLLVPKYLILLGIKILGLSQELVDKNTRVTIVVTEHGVTDRVTNNKTKD